MRLAPVILSLLIPAFGAEQYRIFDPLAVPAEGDPASAVVTVTRPSTVPRIECDLVVAGGGLGGVSAALAGARGGLRVCLTEATRWLGGQMTSQGVSALDENRWIETTGSTSTYLDLRARIRAAYENSTLPQARGEHLNPGRCWVSLLCFEPKVGVDVLDRMLAPYRKNNHLRVLMRTAPVAAARAGKRIESLLVYNFENHRFTELRGKVFIDATELGDLLPLAGAGFRTGAESKAETGEPDAPEAADPESLQSFTYPFVLSENAVRGITVRKPGDYDDEKKQFSFVIDYGQGRTLHYGMFDRLPGTPGSFWDYRRLIAAEQFAAGHPADLSMINWPGNDVCDPDYLAEDPLRAARAFQRGKQVALGFAWWIQHEAPRDKGDGAGYPEIRLRSDVLGTEDGLSQYPYIRESRRMEALRTVREQDVAEPWQSGERGAAFDDSAGIGFYPIDIHGCRPHKPLPRSKPYQVPLGALISRDVPNLLAGAKNIGTTHITNGAYRLHPTEWAIGEADGRLAVQAVRHRRDPGQIRSDREALRALQWQLLQAGHPLVWFDDVAPDDRAFAAIQFAAIDGLLPVDAATLHFRPSDAVSGAQAASSLSALAQRVSGVTPVPAGIVSSAELEWKQLAPLGHGAGKKSGKVARSEFARWLVSWRTGR